MGGFISKKSVNTGNTGDPAQRSLNTIHDPESKEAVKPVDNTKAQNRFESPEPTHPMSTPFLNTNADELVERDHEIPKGLVVPEARQTTQYSAMPTGQGRKPASANQVYYDGDALSAAEQLDLDPEADGELMWIADRFAHTTLSPPWVIFVDQV